MEEVNLSAEGVDEGEKGDDCSAAGGFDPSEDEMVLHFLRPQLRGFPPRVAGAVLEADPCAAPPWDLLARHGLHQQRQGHFFAARRRRKPLVRRSVGGGSWMHSSTRCGRSVTDMGVVVRWCRVKFCFYVRAAGGGQQQQQQRSTGWVMEEYEITDPRCYRRDDEGEEDDYWVLCRVRKSKRPKSPAKAKAKAKLVAQARRRRFHLEPDSRVKSK